MQPAGLPEVQLAEAASGPAQMDNGHGLTPPPSLLLGDVPMTLAVEAQPARKAVFGVLLLSGSNAFRLGVQFLLFPILARLLTPADYGIMALAMPVVLFAMTLGEGGMGPALVRSPDPDGSVEATMFWTALATGIGCASILLLAAPLIAGALSHAAIAPVLSWLAPIMVLSAMCSVPSARIQKRGATWIFALGDVASTVTGGAVALYGALTGWQVWSLVAQQLVLWIVKFAVLLGFAGSRGHGRPGREAFRYLWLHGPPLVGANLLTLFSASIDTMLIGRLLGVAPLGFYALAYQIVRIPEAVLTGPIYVSFLPAIARLDGDSPAAARLFLSTLRMMLGVAAPMMLGLTLTADLAVSLVLGPRWFGTAPLIMVLAPSAIVQTLGYLATALLIGRGRSGLQFRLALLNAFLTLAGVVAGSFFGIFGVAIGVAVAVAAGSMIALAAGMREVNISLRRLASALSPVLAAVAIMVCGTGGLRLLLPATLPVVPSLILVAGAGVLLYAGAMRLLAPETVTAALAPFRRPSLS
jgi:PST family polysaccharide transporter